MWGKGVRLYERGPAPKYIQGLILPTGHMYASDECLLLFDRAGRLHAAQPHVVRFRPVLRSFPYTEPVKESTVHMIIRWQPTPLSITKGHRPQDKFTHITHYTAL